MKNRMVVINTAHWELLHERYLGKGTQASKLSPAGLKVYGNEAISIQSSPQIERSGHLDTKTVKAKREKESLAIRTPESALGRVGF